MANLTFITVGTLKEGYLRDAVAEYTKRISQYARVEEISLKEERIRDEDDETEIRRALSAEGERILASVPKGAVIVALCVEGKEYDSVALSSLIGKLSDERGKIVFVIGSSHGLSDEVKRAADVKLSVSKLTFPHQLMRVILAETVYRSLTILAGKKYHK